MILQASLSADSALVVTACAGNTAIVWSAADGRRISTLSGHTDHVASGAFSPDGRRIVTASWDGTAKVWDGKDGHLLATFAASREALVDARFSADGARVVAETRSGASEAWDVRRLTQSPRELSRDACNVLLGAAHRRFTADQIAADPLLQGLWRDPRRDVCEGVAGAAR